MPKICEKWYPYVVALLLVVGISRLKSDFLISENTNDALTAIITVDSLVIGFIGAILPVIMSMKNDSEFVKYVFKKDKDKLFLRYIKQTLFIGIILIVVAITLYFRDQYIGSYYYKLSIKLCTYFLVCFLLCTYRCLNNILNLVFSNDDPFKNDQYNIKSEKEEHFRSRVIKEQQENEQKMRD